MQTGVQTPRGTTGSMQGALQPYHDADRWGSWERWGTGRPRVSWWSGWDKCSPGPLASPPWPSSACQWPHRPPEAPWPSCIASWAWKGAAVCHPLLLGVAHMEGPAWGRAAGPPGSMASPPASSLQLWAPLWTVRTGNPRAMLTIWCRRPAAWPPHQHSSGNEQGVRPAPCCPSCPTPVHRRIFSFTHPLTPMALPALEVGAQLSYNRSPAHLS